MNKKVIGLWSLTAVLSLYFAANGITKLMGHPHVVENFRLWGYSSAFLTLIGVVELACGILLLPPRTAFAGVVVLVGIMFGAIGTHVLHAEWAHALIPIVVLGLLSIVGFARRPAWLARYIPRASSSNATYGGDARP